METEKNGIAIGSLVCGIVSASISALAIPVGILLSIWGCGIAVAGIATGIVAIVLGVKGKNFYPSGRAIAGFVLGIIGTAMHAIIFLCFLIVHLIY